MLPEDVLQAIDEVGGNRIRFLTDAARAKLQAGRKRRLEMVLES